MTEPALALSDGGAEGGQVGVEFVVLADGDVGDMAGGLGAAVDGEVLGGGDDAVVARIVALHAGDEGYAHAGGEKGIFAVGLLAAAPAGIAKDVDVGRPEVEALEKRLARFSRWACSYLMRPSVEMASPILMDGGRVEGGGEADGLRELGDAVR